MRYVRWTLALTLTTLCAAQAACSAGWAHVAAAASSGNPSEPIAPVVTEPTNTDDDTAYTPAVVIYGAGGGSAGGSPMGTAASDTNDAEADEEPEADVTPEPPADETPAPDGLAPMWERRFGGETFNASGDDVAVDGDGATYVVGSTSGTIAEGQTHQGKSDAFVARLTPEGELDWVTQFGTADQDQAEVILFDGESLLVAGTTRGNLFGDMAPDSNDSIVSWSPVDIWLARYATDGTLEWSTQLGLSSQYALTDLCMTTDTEGNIYTIFTTMGPLPGSEALDETAFSRVNIGLAKCDAEGNLLWTKCIGGDGRDCARALLIGDDGTLYIIGQTESEWETPLTESDSGDLLIVAADREGEQLWARQYGSAKYDTATDACLDGAIGDIYITGYSGADFAGEHQGQSDGFLLCVDAQGEWLWADAIATVGHDMPGALALEANGTILVLGTLIDANAKDRRAFAIQYDTDGNRTAEITIDTDDDYPSINGARLDTASGVLHTVGSAAKTNSDNWAATAMAMEYPFRADDPAAEPAVKESPVTSEKE